MPRPERRDITFTIDRLWAEQWFEQHPEILARPLPHPVIVVGPMRSGTTRMHRLLAADHRFTHMRSFETISPVPRPGFLHGGHDFREDITPMAASAYYLVVPLGGNTEGLYGESSSGAARPVGVQACAVPQMVDACP